MYQKETSSFTGPRMHLVMLALPSALRGIIAEEVHHTYANAHAHTRIHIHTVSHTNTHKHTQTHTQSLSLICTLVYI